MHGVMILRSFDLDDLMETMGPYMHELHGFYPEEWLADKENIALTDGAGSFNLFQHDGNGVYYAHTFYKRRGKDARDMARASVKEMFEKYPTQALKGLTPTEKRGACWLTRQAGFKSYGVVNTVAGPCELFILTRSEYERESL